MLNGGGPLLGLTGREMAQVLLEAAHCGQVVFLRNGRLLESGTPDELIGRFNATDLEDAFVKTTRAAEAADKDSKVPA